LGFLVFITYPIGVKVGGDMEKGNGGNFTFIFIFVGDTEFELRASLLLGRRYSA
jgi:hypothetical protein